MKLKVLVGTLYSGEAEFEESRMSVTRQINCEIEHYVISNLSEYKAHNLLWDTFNARKVNFNLLVKVDADTVLTNNTLFYSVHTKLWNSSFAGAQLPLFDFFCREEINGLGIFLPSIQFNPSHSRLFADRAIDRKRYRIANRADLQFQEEVGLHCVFPSDMQSFRYGLHRWKKGQYAILNQVKQDWLKSQNESRGWALAGAIVASEKRFAKYEYGKRGFAKNFKYLNSLDDINRWVRDRLHRLDDKFPK